MIPDAFNSFLVVLLKALTVFIPTYTPPNIFDFTLISAAASILPITDVFVFFGWMLTYASATSGYLLFRWAVRLIRGA